MDKTATTPRTAAAPQAPMRIGKRHDPEDDFVAMPRASSADAVSPRAAVATQSTASVPTIAAQAEPLRHSLWQATARRGSAA